MTATPPPAILRVSEGTSVVLRQNFGVNPHGSGPLLYAGAVGNVVAYVEQMDGYKVEFPGMGRDLVFLSRDGFAIRKNRRDTLLFEAVPQPDADALYPYIGLSALVGSRAYNLHRPESDEDVRGFFLAPPAMHWSLSGVPEQFETGPHQTYVNGPDRQVTGQYWELGKLVRLALRANPTALETLISPVVRRTTPVGIDLQALARQGLFYSKLVYETFLGYANSQFRKMEQDMRNGRGVKMKHAMHLLRLLMAARDLVATGTLDIWLPEESPERAFLIEVREERVPWSDLDVRRRELHRQLDDAYATTRLPDQPDYAEANAFLLGARKLQFEGRGQH